MKKQLTIFVLFFLSYWSADAQQNIFHKVYGGGNYVSAQAVLQCPDSNFVVIGTMNSNDGNLNDVLFLKIDTLGNVLLEKKYGGASIDVGKWATFNHDSTAIMAVGFSSSFSSEDIDVYALYFDLNGDTIWTNTYGGSNWDYAYHVIPTKDKCFLITGETYSYGAGNNDAFALKIDTNGTVLWESVVGGALLDYAYSAVETANDLFVLLGSSNSFSAAEDLDFYAVALNQQGDTVWTKTYGASVDDYGTTNCLYFFGSDSLIVLGGYATGEVRDTQHFFIIDYWGNEIRHEAYSAIQIRHTVIKAQPDTSGFYYTIQRKDYPGARVTPFLVSYSVVFYFSGLKAYDTTRDSYPFNIIRTFDGGYLMVGETESCGTVSSTSMFLYKIDENLNASVNISNICNNTVNLALDIETWNGSKKILLFPNPVSVGESFTITTDDVAINEIAIFDVQGRKMMQRTLSNEYVFQTEIGNWPSGMYFVHIKNDVFQTVQKLIVR